jgi:ATP-dependent helicase/DNAse subunit B
MSEKKHISYSELKTWAECPYKHKLKYKDGIKGFVGNIYTAFGTAIHEVCENIAKGLLTEDVEREEI